jgi:hypothetical protein
MTRIHALRTGLVQVRQPQMEARRSGPGGVADMLFDEEWSEWLPIYAWAIEHDEGVIVADSGETAGTRTRVLPVVASVSTGAPRASPFTRMKSSAPSCATAASGPAMSGRSS